MEYGAATMGEFGNFLLRQFGQLGIDQAEAARRMKMSPSTLNEIINKPDRVPSAKSLRKLAAVIGISVDELSYQAEKAVANATEPAGAGGERKMPESVRGLSESSFAYLSQMTPDELERWLSLLKQNRNRAG